MFFPLLVCATPEIAPTKWSKIVTLPGENPTIRPKQKLIPLYEQTLWNLLSK